MYRGELSKVWVRIEVSYQVDQWSLELNPSDMCLGEGLAAEGREAGAVWGKGENMDAKGGMDKDIIEQRK